MGQVLQTKQVLWILITISAIGDFHMNCHIRYCHVRCHVMYWKVRNVLSLKSKRYNCTIELIVCAVTVSRPSMVRFEWILTIYRKNYHFITNLSQDHLPMHDVYDIYCNRPLFMRVFCKNMCSVKHFQAKLLHVYSLRLSFVFDRCLSDSWSK